MNAVSEKPPLPAAGGNATPVPARKRRSRLVRILRPAIGVFVLVAALVTAGWWFTEGRYVQSTDNAYVQGDIAVLSPRIDGNIAAILVQDNQFVRAGDPLIRLDDADWKARLDQARAAAAEAAAAVTTANRQIDQQHAMIDAAGAFISQAQAELVRAAADASRATTLVGTGAGSRQAADQAIADARKADAALRSAQAQKIAAEQLLSVYQAQALQAEARKDNAGAQVRLAEDNLSYTVIRAPFDGYVGNRAAQLGQHVAAGTQLIAVAPPPAQLYVVANFKETQLKRMRPGQPVRLVADIDGDDPITGRVDSLAPATGALFSLMPPENATGNFTKVVQRVPVKIVIDPELAARAHWLRAGLSVTAEVDTRGPDAKRLGLFGAAAQAATQLIR
ncbi:MAG: HlyD family secretion protein [Proteobacteria bacterium]|nr:HlyD family secretion protein [Pseudomonadota bacterium]